MYRFVLICFLLLLSNIVMIQAQIECPNALPPQLVLGAEGQVTPGGANRVRNMPTTSGAQVGEIPGGGVFLVLGGPACADGYTWWFVSYGNVVGWTVESGNEYWVVPRTLSRSELPTPPPLPDTLDQASYEGVRFDFGADVAAGVTGITVPGVVDDGTVPFWTVGPEHIRFDFDDYVVTDAGWASVSLYPAREYELLKQTSLDELRELLAERPETPFPTAGLVINAASVFTVQPRYVDFENGSGVRYLVHLSQAPTLVTNGGYVLYIFSGLTDDGSTFVQAVFPLESILMPPLEVIFNEEFNYQSFFELYDHYLAATARILDAAPASAFTPDLSRLDALVASLSVGAAEGVDAGTDDECATLKPRLIVDELARQALAQDSLRVRDTPGGAATGDNIFPGEMATVLEGPVCLNNVNWWHISSAAGWTGWVGEAGTDRYFFDPVTRTPTPTMTFTPSPTFTPGPTRTPAPTPTLITSDCVVSAFADTNTRGLPDVTSGTAFVLRRGEERYATYQYQLRGEPFPWWYVAPNQLGFFSGWVRADFVEEIGNCDALPALEWEELVDEDGNIKPIYSRHR